MIERDQSKLFTRFLIIASGLALLGVLFSLLLRFASLHRENARLRARLTAMADLEGENAELRGQLDQVRKPEFPPQTPPTETLRLRGQIGSLRQQLLEAEERERRLRESLALSEPNGRSEMERLMRENRVLQRATNSMPPRPPRIGAWLGVNISNATNQSLAAGNPRPGVLIQTVTSDSPASRSQLRAGDLVVKLDDQEIGEVQQFKRILSQRNVNQLLVLEVIRDNEAMRIEVTPTDWPQ